MIYSIQNRKNAKLENYILGGSIIVGVISAIVFELAIKRVPFSYHPILSGAGSTLGLSLLAYLILMLLTQAYKVARERKLVMLLGVILAAAVCLPVLVGADFTRTITSYREYRFDAFQGLLFTNMFGALATGITELAGESMGAKAVAYSCSLILMLELFLLSQKSKIHTWMSWVYALSIALTPFFVLAWVPTNGTVLLILLLYSYTLWNTRLANNLSIFFLPLAGLPGVLLFCIQRRKELKNKLVCFAGVVGLLLCLPQMLLFQTVTHRGWLADKLNQPVLYVISSPEYQFENYGVPPAISDMLTALPVEGEEPEFFKYLARSSFSFREEMNTLSAEDKARLRFTYKADYNRYAREFITASKQLLAKYPAVYLRGRIALLDLTTASNYGLNYNSEEWTARQETNHLSNNITTEFAQRGIRLQGVKSWRDWLFSGKSLIAFCLCVQILWMLTKFRDNLECIIISWGFILWGIFIQPNPVIYPYATAAALNLFVLLEIFYRWEDKRCLARKLTHQPPTLS